MFHLLSTYQFDNRPVIDERRFWRLISSRKIMYMQNKYITTSAWSLPQAVFLLLLCINKLLNDKMMKTHLIGSLSWITSCPMSILKLIAFLWLPVVTFPLTEVTWKDVLGFVFMSLERCRATVYIGRKAHLTTAHISHMSLTLPDSSQKQHAHSSAGKVAKMGMYH